MGSNASVLQWNCYSCSQINPTEKFKCVKCGNLRSNENKFQIINDSQSDHRLDTAHQGQTIRSPNFTETVDEDTDVAIKVPPKTELTGNCETDLILKSGDYCFLQWECNDCKQLNSHTEIKQCTSCNSLKPQEPTVIEKVDISKIRKHHSAVSDSERKTSEKMKRSSDCHTSLEVEQFEEKSSSWICLTCTFNNAGMSTKCTICDAPRSNGCVATIAKYKHESKMCNCIKDGKENKTCTCSTINLETKVVEGGDIKENVTKADEISPNHLKESPEKKPKITWCCPTCTLENPDSLKKCKICGYINNQDDILFNGVKLSDQSATTSSDLDKGKLWHCKRCTLKNSITAHICDACGTKREIRLPSEDDIAEFDIAALNDTVIYPHENIPGTSTKTINVDKPKNAEKGMWPCPRCTFQNPAPEQTCEMCAFKIPECSKVAKGKGQGKNSKPNFSNRDLAVLPRPFKLQRQKTMCMEDLRLNDENQSLQMWRHIALFCNENKEPFVDDSFPPAEKSLYYNPAAKQNKRNVVWLRPHQIRTHDASDAKTEWKVFRTPLPSDIVQGVLGNCWFLSALAVMAEIPELIKTVVITKEYCSEGVYLIRLCNDGLWTTMIVDDLFPCDDHGFQLYSQARRKQLWVSLIEKAFAKIHGCYESLTAGRCIEALATLTGFPCESLQLQATANDEVEKDLVWVQMLSSRESKFLMGASCGGGNMKVSDDIYAEMGLKSRHAYSILNVQDVEGNRLVQLRNPWGRFSWNGDWSDKSQKWNILASDVRHNLMPHGAEEGVFWMSLADMMVYFDSIDICKYRSDWMESRVQGSFPFNSLGEVSITDIEIFQPTQVEFGLFQEGTRSQERSVRNPVDLCIVVLQKENQMNLHAGRLLCHSKRQVKSFVGCNTILETGNYIVVCMALNHWTQDTPKTNLPPKYVLTVHSSKGLVAEPLKANPYVLADTIIQLALTKGQPHEGRNGMTTFYLTHGWSGFIVVVENRRPQDAIHVKCDCTGSLNVVSTRAGLTTIDSVPPLHRQVLIILTQLEGSSSYSITHRLVHRSCSVGPFSNDSDLQDWAPGCRNKPTISKEMAGLHEARPI